jgi:cellulose synthase (UDP-forming)
VAIYLNLFFAMYLIPFLIAASVLIFTSNYKGEEAGLLAKSA